MKTIEEIIKENSNLKKEINRLKTEMRNFYFSTVLDWSSMNIQEIRQLQREAIDTGKSISEVYASSKCMYDRKHLFDCLEVISRIIEEKPENMLSLIKIRIENCYNLIKMGVIEDNKDADSEHL